MAKWKVAGINFDHLHMGDLLREAFKHPDAEIVGICDDEPRAHAGRRSPISAFPADRVFTDPEMPRRDEARPGDPLPGDRRTCDLGRARRAVRRPHPGREAVRRLARRGRPHDRGDGEDRQAARHQLAARLVSLAYHHQAPDRRRRDRRCHRSPFLRRQPRPALPSRRQGRGQRRGGAEGASRLVVLQPGFGRRQPARLSRLRRDARHLVHERRGADRSHLRRGRAGGSRSRRAFGDRLPLRRGLSKFETRWGTFTDPWTHAAAAEMRLRDRRHGGTIASYDYDDHVTRADAGEARAAHVPVRHARRAAPRTGRIHAPLHRNRREDRRPARSKARRASASRSPTAPCCRRARSAPWRCCHERAPF